MPCSKCGDERVDNDLCEECFIDEGHEVDPESDFIENGGIFAGDESDE